MNTPFAMIDRLRDSSAPTLPTVHLVWVEIVKRVHATQNPTITFRSHDIAAAAGISRRRLADALSILNTHGLITYEPYRGAPDQHLTVLDADTPAADGHGHGEHDLIAV